MRKNINITGISIFLVVFIFLLQVFLLFRLYQTSIGLLQKELDEVAAEVYQTDINLRLVEQSNVFVNNIIIHKSDSSIGKDSTEVIIRGKRDKVANNANTIQAVNTAVEQCVSEKWPIHLEAIDSIAALALKRYSINLSFYSEIVDLKNQKVLNKSLPPSVHPKLILSSNDIPINVDQTRALRLVLIDPLSEILPEMGVMLLLCLIFCSFCIYSFYLHKWKISEFKEKNQQKNDVFAEVSHEFKKPLAVLMQITSALENEKVMLNKERRLRYLSMANDEIYRLSDQTEIFLKMAMDEEGVFDLHYSFFDLEQMLAALSERYLETESKLSSVDIVNQLQVVYIEADKDHLEHIVSNLLSNAIKYSKESVDVVITVSSDCDWFYISVKDNGIGISEKDQLRIFDRYTRVGDTSLVKGYGIGLNYVKRMVEKHRGKIQVKSKLEEGSEFIIHLPLSKG